MSNILRMPFLPSYHICVDEANTEAFKGRLYYGLNVSGEEVTNIETLLLKMDQIMDRIDFPQSSVDKRNFDKEERKIYPDRDKRREEIMTMKRFHSPQNMGMAATFIVQVSYRQNACWQGTIQWVERNKSFSFNSVLDFVKLINIVRTSNQQQHEIGN